MESQLRDGAVNDDKPSDFIRDPYPYFAQKRNGAGVFHGTVVDYSKTPESLRPDNSFAAMRPARPSMSTSEPSAAACSTG